MLSRVAESIFWLSRYLERAENVARFIEVSQNLSLGAPTGTAPQWSPLVFTTGDQDLFKKLYGEDEEDDSPAIFTQNHVLHFLTFEERNPNSLMSCLSAARHNARSVRENLPMAMWEEINRFYLNVRAASLDARTLRQPSEFLIDVKRAGQQVAGVAHNSMSRGEGWHFAQMGRHMERADKTSRILDVKYFLLLPNPHDVGTTLDINQWAALLESTNALQMYRRCHGRIVPVKVAQFLILNREFPRSIHYCVLRTEQSLHAVMETDQDDQSTLVEQSLGRLRNDLEAIHVNAIIDQGIHQFIDGIQVRLNRIGDALHEQFFAMKPME